MPLCDKQRWTSWTQREKEEQGGKRMKHRFCWQQQRNTILYSSYVLLHRGTCCQLTEINLGFWRMHLFYLQGWKCCLQQKAFLHPFDLTSVNVIQLSVWLCRTAIMSIRLNLYSCHLVICKIKCPGALGGKVLLVGKSAKAISNLAFNKACRRCRRYNLSPPRGV